MKYLVISVLLLISVACSGSDVANISPNPVTVSSNVFVNNSDKKLQDLRVVSTSMSIPKEGKDVSYQLWKSGKMSHGITNLKVFLRDPGNLSYWYQFLTLETLEDPKEILKNYNAFFFSNIKRNICSLY